MISHYTWLNLLRFAYPEKSEKWVKREAKKRMDQQHKFIRGPEK